MSFGFQSSSGGELTFLPLNSIVTSFRYKQTWPVVIRLLNDKVFGDATQLITHSFKLEETLEAFQTCVTASERSIKVQILDD